MSRVRPHPVPVPFACVWACVRACVWACVSACALAGLASPGRAGVSAQQAARLAADLTPVGAERAGNTEGTVPAWTGGISEPPPDYEPGGWHPDPFAADEPRFSISAADAARHAEQLSPGQRALLDAHPETWHVNVYPTHRSAAFPDWVYEALAENATRAELVTEGKGSVANARVTSPFPIPRSGVEVVWNHTLRWRGVRVRRAQGLAAVTRAGNYRLILQRQDFGFPYGARRDTDFKRRYPNWMLAIKSKTISPELLSGNGALVIEPIDQTRSPRMAWAYSRDLRRVLRVPFFAYDFPAPNSENIRTVDDAFLFNGPPDRFEWKLLGKREMYVPYNAYRLHSSEVGPGDILRVGHIEPALARYELHRVWVVEGTLREGERHVYGRRVFYVDEDSWRILVSESYDLDGKLWRVAEAHTVNHYEVPVPWATLEVYHDLKDGRYQATGLDNGRMPLRFENDADPREFSPNALLYYIR